MFGLFKKKYSSKEINVAYEHMSPLQQKHFGKMTDKVTPEKAMEALGVKDGVVPEYETREQWHKIKKHL